MALATKACELTKGEDAGYLDTLACAYAESGDFAEAVRGTEKVIALARPEDQDEYRQRLAQFQAGTPFRTGNV